ncbi:unnamed protein product, partial [Nesidiocoris tenuis]
QGESTRTSAPTWGLARADTVDQPASAAVCQSTADRRRGGGAGDRVGSSSPRLHFPSLALGRLLIPERRPALGCCGLSFHLCSLQKRERALR